jgi:hypothetical protein
MWRPAHVPAGATALGRDFDVDRVSVFAVVWVWPFSGGLPQVDSLVVETSDPGARRIVVPFRRESSGYVDVDPPAAPVLGLPRDGTVFRVGQSFPVLWTRISDCSGIRSYDLQIAADRDFREILLDARRGISTGTIIIEPGDEGQAFWRVRARDGSAGALVGPWSQPRSWMVQ